MAVPITGLYTGLTIILVAVYLTHSYQLSIFTMFWAVAVVSSMFGSGRSRGHSYRLRCGLLGSVAVGN